MVDDEKKGPPEAAPVPEILQNPGEFRVWSPEDLAKLREALEAADETEVAERVDVPQDLPPEAGDAIDELEDEYEESVDAKRHELLRLRAGVLTGVLRRLQQAMDMGFKIPGTHRVAEFVDLHTVENVMEFAMELFPFVGGAYAITGYRLDVREHPETNDRTLDLEKINWVDRILYGLGELMVSGHVLRGITKSILKRGVKHVAKNMAKDAGRRAAENLTRRAKKGFDRERKKLVKKMTGSL